MATRVSKSPVVQDRVIVLVSEEESAGELFRFEYIACEVTPPPTDHVHTEQEELVEVLQGTLRCRVAGIERVLCPGERIVIAPGIAHAVWNEDPLGSRSIGEYRPAINAQRMFRAYIVEA